MENQTINQNNPPVSLHLTRRKSAPGWIISLVRNGGIAPKPIAVLDPPIPDNLVLSFAYQIAEELGLPLEEAYL